MLNADFDVMGRLVSVRYAKKGVNSKNNTATGKYFVTIGRDYKSRKSGTPQYQTAYLEFSMWNNNQRQPVASLTTYVKQGDVVDLSGRIVPQHQDQNGNWYHQELNVYGFRRIARSFKNQKAVNIQYQQQGGFNQNQPQQQSITPQNNNKPMNNGFNNGNNGQPMNNANTGNRQPMNNANQNNNQNMNNNNSNNRPMNNGNNANTQSPIKNSKKVNIKDSNLPF